MTGARSNRTPLTSYQWRLFGFLSVASFFEGYDFFALAQLLPNLRSHFGLPAFAGAAMVGFINFGTVIAVIPVLKMDAWGRRRMLMVTITGYTLCTLMSGLSWDVWTFATFQMLGRVFLIAEWATSMVYAAEEFPADRRGMVIGVIQAIDGVGAITCAGIVPLLLTSPLGWRSVYLVGVIPLILLAIWRRGLQESRRFAEQVENGRTAGTFYRIFKTPYAKRVLQLGAIWALTYVCTQTGVTFWKEFAVAERGMSDAEVGFSITVAAAAAMPLAFFSGKLLDIVGRRLGAVIIFLTTAGAILGAYNLESRAALTVALALGVFGNIAVLPVLNAFTTELFPTELRGNAFAWSNNIIGRWGYVIAPFAVGLYAGDYGWGPTVSLTTISLLAALVLILWWLPETKGKELEDAAAL